MFPDGLAGDAYACLCSKAKGTSTVSYIGGVNSSFYKTQGHRGAKLSRAEQEDP